jgi:hypothetical protein
MRSKMLLGFVALVLAASAQAREVLVVMSPGFSFEEHRPLIEALQHEEHEVHVVGASCAAANSGELIERLRLKDRELGGGYTVVSHGLGATIALLAAPELQADEYVLLAPVLEVLPSRSMAALAEPVIDRVIALEQEPSWVDIGLREVLLGGPKVMNGCLSMGLGREFQGWLGHGGAPLKLKQIEAFVWLGVSLGDEMSTVEATVPASRSLPNRHLVRFGINRFDSRDFSHWDLLSDPVPLRTAARQIGRGR